jgi:hypothetical protein
MGTLKQEIAKIQIDSPEKIPKIVRGLENPQSIFALPGKISLFVSISTGCIVGC